MKINYCLPIITKKKQEVLAVIDNNKNDYQYFEVWLDYIEDLDEEFMQELISRFKNKLIMLFRRQGLEAIHMPLQKRFDIIRLLSKSKVLLDLDITTQKEELAFSKEQQLPLELILSYHDYKETPDEGSLNSLAQKMSYYEPTIYKVATTCNSANDAIRLLQIQQSFKEEKKKHIVLGMGKFGTITRVYGTLWGNEMIFAPQKKANQSAPGQLTKQQLDNIFSELI